MEMPGKTFFVSDLHLLSRRSQAQKHEAQIQETAGRAKTFVLGGDIFDFTWSVYSSPQRSVEEAMRWIDRLVGANTACQFHFIFGNHDYNRRFISALEDYERSTVNLTTHRYVLRLDESVFLHGDAAEHPEMCHTKLEHYRSKYLSDELRAPLQHLLYDVAVQARLHRVASRLANPKKRVARRLHGYLQRVGHGPEQGIEHVYFGHTHEPMHGYQYGGLTFHNPGAPMAGVPFRIVETIEKE
jgi:UDP-2,3-diacylglucosamine hydrolase